MSSVRGLALVLGTAVVSSAVTATVIGVRPVRAQRDAQALDRVTPKVAVHTAALSQPPQPDPTSSAPPDFPPSAEPAPASDPPTARLPAATPGPAAAPQPAVAEDPEQSATAYIEKTRREATTELASLRNEEARLRERLKKVESAVRRWEGLLTALDPARNQPPAAEPVADLQPIAPPTVPNPNPPSEPALVPPGAKELPRPEVRSVPGDPTPPAP